MARKVAPSHLNLFFGDKGRKLEDVAPHLVRADELGVVAELALGPEEHGVAFETFASDRETTLHLRRFLLVRRASTGRKVLFRFYDPRILRPFLTACTWDELHAFFGPISAFHCPGEEAGAVLTFTLQAGGLHLKTTERTTFLSEHFPERLKALERPRQTSIGKSSAGG